MQDEREGEGGRRGSEREGVGDQGLVCHGCVGLSVGEWGQSHGYEHGHLGLDFEGGCEGFGRVGEAVELRRGGEGVST